ncbi:hypothetical protein BC940DRAFT_319169 [Gongronella butleri]|nr:hypothetical protein BC940DRAFT_319169 [Gongronella butleri]
MNLLLFHIVFLVSCTLRLVQAQGIYIASPKENSRLTGGQRVTVQVVRPNYILTASEVGIAIGIKVCDQGQRCPPPEAQLGTALYVGPFKPQFHEEEQSPYENFTVTVPQGEMGPASLNLVRFFLIGAGPSSTIQSTNITVNIADR